MSSMPAPPDASKTSITAIAAGVLVALTFSLLARQASPPLAIILTGIPLFALGFGLGNRATLNAALSAFITLAMLEDVTDGLTFLVLFLLPMLWLVRRSLLFRPAAGASEGGAADQERREWFPLGLALSELLWLPVVLVLLAAAHYAGQDSSLEAAVSTLLSTWVEMNRAALGPEADVLRSGMYGFLIVGLTAWMWLLLLYAAAWLGHAAVGRLGRRIRPSLRLLPFIPPLALLAALAAAGLLSLFSEGEAAFLAKTLVFILLLPYFLAGMAELHQRAVGWPGRVLWLTLLYAALIVFSPVVMAVACFGVYLQARALALPPELRG